MTTPDLPTRPPVDVCTWLGRHGFISSASGRVHRHPTTGARVVIHNTDQVDLTVHAHGGAWRARLTRVPFPVIAATVAALDRKDAR
ncbi:hypothetical protein [Saccharothrix syringae]|uniref:Uncharacterized protein n=1 Tax=Saccharothrix syringae TaxID=103733 RepID=A0A5Q0GX77_SACSY|nr:hypothetical protein [Saccharothrix syringae]QFZ18493.1 hypothetical protein EKG83_14310 [Saccharothrix syringae]